MDALNYSCSICAAPPGIKCPDVLSGQHKKRGDKPKLEFLGIYQFQRKDKFVIALCDNFGLTKKGIERIYPRRGLIYCRKMTAKDLRLKWGLSLDKFNEILDPILKNLTAMPQRESLSDRAAQKRKTQFDWESWRKHKSKPNHRYIKEEQKNCYFTTKLLTREDLMWN